MKKEICHIVCAGEKFNLPKSIGEYDFVIAVDGGYNYLLEAGITPDLIVGDFDSLNYVPNGENVIKLPKVKDDTDTLYAIKYAIMHGIKEFHIYCGTGGRLEHTLANIQCLAYIAENNLKGILYDKDNMMTAIRNCELKIAESTGFVSVFSLTSKALGVNIEGLKYPLNNYTMLNSVPVGVNNEFIGKMAKISVKDGTLLIRLPITASL